MAEQAQAGSWFTPAAMATWLACGLWQLAKIFDGTLSGWPAAVYVAVFTLYGMALLLTLLPPRCRGRVPFFVPLTLVLLQALTSIAANLDTAIFLHGTGIGIGLMVIVAAQLPYFLTSRWTWIWIVAQTVWIPVGIGGLTTDGVIASVTFVIAAIGFQVFAATSSVLTLRERQARATLIRANAELMATRGLLAETSRISERVRISRDLHDTLGHHLAALSLQLDVASRVSHGQATERIQQAHAIVRLLLSDVRNVVTMLRETSTLNVAGAIRALAQQSMRAAVHLDIPDGLVVEDPARAEALVRAVQEVLTNTARHAHARHLWIRVEPAPHGITLLSRDDGRGTDLTAFGNGLRGMRERFEEHGGRVDVTSAPGAGFEVRAFMPLAVAT